LWGVLWYRSGSQTLWNSITWDFFFFLVELGAWNQGFTKQVLYHLSPTSSPFSSGSFGDGISRTICQGWPGTLTFQISASQVAKITGVWATGVRLKLFFFFKVQYTAGHWCLMPIILTTQEAAIRRTMIWS
jgi:hypothetical protein